MLMSNKILQLWSKYGLFILIILAVILTAFVAFRAGQSQQKHTRNSDIKISINPLDAANPAQEDIKTLGETLARKGINTSEISSPVPTNGLQQNSIPQNCALVGSKNSDKYHEPDCDSAKKIKPENIICFSSIEDALSKGYKAAKCCH